MEDLNGYVCFYKNQRVEVHASSSYAAQLKAAEIFKCPKKHSRNVAVMLAEKNGEQVVHKPLF